jgi:hypothetical protein
VAAAEATDRLAGHAVVQMALVSATRVIGFVATTLACAIVLNAFLFLVLAARDKSRMEPTECEFKEVRCGAVMEFVYDESWPLVPLLSLLVCVPIGLLIARRISR